MQSSAAGMPHCTDLQRAVDLLDGPGACNLEVLLSCDTRSDVAWFPALAPFRVAWAWGHRARVYVDRVGNVPACVQRRSLWWHKVFITQRLLKCRRVKLLLWLDTDGTIAPMLDQHRHQERSDTLQFPSLQELFDRAIALLRAELADGGVPADGGVLANGGVPCFIGYRDKSDQQEFNAGAWLVAGGDVAPSIRFQ